MEKFVLEFNDNNTRGHIFQASKNQAVTSLSDNSHFQCVISMIGIGYQIV